MSCCAGTCDEDGCTRYSDVDVYYEDGTSDSKCAEHAWDSKDTVQLVSQHGSDNINREHAHECVLKL